MNVMIKDLCLESEKQYSQFLKKIPHTLLYHSIKYRNFLNQVLVNARSRYLLAYDDGNIVAAIPAFIKKGPFGTVINSLPFYGSNGSILFCDRCTNSTKTQLLRQFYEMCEAEGAVASTVIENPLSRVDQLFVDHKPDLLDRRIGQFTKLPKKLSTEKVSEHLMSKFHEARRRNIRKAKKSGFYFGHSDSDETLRALYFLHETNIRAISGIAKSWDVFEAFRDNFRYDEDYRIYTAEKNGQVAAALLVFFFNKTAEYFIPATHIKYRSEQPLSYLIFWAMQDAVAKECRWWNWGGTWISQKGVYDFKSKWGTVDLNYKYYIKFHSDVTALKELSKEDILEAYPNFYVLPFAELSR